MDKIEIELGWCTLVISNGEFDVLVKGTDSRATVKRWKNGEERESMIGNCFTVSKPD